MRIVFVIMKHLCDYAECQWFIALGVNNAGGERSFWAKSSPNTSVCYGNLDHQRKRTCKYPHNFHRMSENFSNLVVHWCVYRLQQTV